MRTLKANTVLKTLRAACGALVVFLATPAHAALPTPHQLQVFASLDDTQRVQLLIKLARSGDADAVNLLLQKHPLQGPYARNRNLYIKGLLQKNQGDFTGAAETFRAALADDPNLTLVRAELAQTLVILEEDDSATHHLRLLAADAPDEKAASGVRAFIDQVDARTPYKISGYVSLAPSTNLNNGSKRTTVYTPIGGGLNLGINEDSREQSGVGVAAGFNAAYNKRLGNNYTLVAAAGASVRLYTKPDYNTYTLSQSLELRRLMDKGHIGLGAVSSQTLDEDKIWPNFASYGPRMSLSLHMTPKDLFGASATYEWRNSLENGGTDSTAILLDTSLTHAIDSTFTATAFGGLDFIDTDRKSTSYATLSGGLSVYKELASGITATATWQVAKTKFDGYDALLGTVREDTRLSGSLTLTKRDLNIYGFAPAITYAYANNFSNSNLYDFDNHGVDVRLTKDF
jgi:outer membrane protein